MTKPLNVIQIIDSLAVGGAEMMAVNIANGLLSRGINSHLCVTRSEGLLKEKVDKNIGYLFLNKKGKVDLKSVIVLKKYIKENKINIVHSHSSSFFIAFLVKMIYPQIKIVWHDHYGKSEKIKERKASVLKLVSLFFSQVISVNKILEHWAKENLRCKKVSFLANFAILKNTNHKTHLKGVEGKRIVCVAAFRPQKDHFSLLQAFSEVKNKYPDWTLHLIGQKHNDIYCNQVVEIIKNKGLENHVFLYGSCLDVKYILNQATIGVLSSNSEGLPVSLLEYGLAGLPVVVTDVGDCKKVVKNCGFVVKKEHVLALSEAILSYVEDEPLRKQKASEFHSHVLQDYSEKAYFSKLIKIYQAC